MSEYRALLLAIPLLLIVLNVCKAMYEWLSADSGSGGGEAILPWSLAALLWGAAVYREFLL